MAFVDVNRASVGFAIDLLMGDLRSAVAVAGARLWRRRNRLRDGGAASQGRQVALMTRSLATQLARSAEVRYRMNLLKRVRANPLITIYEERTLEALDDSGATLAGPAGERITISASFVLVARASSRMPDLKITCASAASPFP